MAKTGDTLEFNFVCRRSNGYFVYRWVGMLLVGCYSLMLYFLFNHHLFYSPLCLQNDLIGLSIPEGTSSLSLSLSLPFISWDPSQVKPYHAIPMERVGFAKAKQPSVRVGCLVLRFFQEISRIDPIYVGFLCRT